MRYKISPCEAAKIIKEKSIPYGEDYEFLYEIDTSNCEEFFGTRCDCNLHVKGKRKAHVDRVDPRKDLVGHLDRDLGIPPWLVIVGRVALVYLIGKGIEAIVKNSGRL